MEDKKKNEKIDTFLTEQHNLTAVDRFSEMHNKAKTPSQEKYYRALLPGPPPGPGQQYAFEVDLDRCSGCKACVAGCHSRNGLDEGELWRNVGIVHGENKFIPLQPLSASELVQGSFVSEVEKEKQLRPTMDCKSGTSLFQEEKKLSPYYFQQHITTACHHCIDPACLSGCPVMAYEKDPQTGIVRHLDDQCIGCKYCIYKCPYEVPQYSQVRGIVRKCDMCAERLKEGEASACVQSCPNEAIRITVVDVNKVKADPERSFQVPESPDPNYTKPTTIYKTKRIFPKSVQAGDHAIYSPQPSEHSLVWMLVLTQASVGIYFLTSLIGVAQSFVQMQSVISFFTALAGLILGTFHLGRPQFAFRSFLGFRTSWLSREVVFYGVYAALNFLSLFSGIVFLPSLKVLTSAVGFLAVLSSGMIYYDTPRPGWNSKRTVLKFFLTAGILGIAQTLWIGSHSQPTMNAKMLSLCLLLLVVLKALAEAHPFISLLHPGDFPIKRSAQLMVGQLKTITILRWSLLFTGVIFIGVFRFMPFNPLVTTIVFSTLLSGEFMERHLFFRSVVPPKMPGYMV